MPSWEDTGSRWISLHIAVGEDRIPKRAGAYAMRCTTDGRAISVSRIFGTDTTGILCFGEAADLKSRLAELCGAVEGRRKAHSEGRRYHRLGYDQRGYRIRRLEVKWVETGSKGEAKKLQDTWFEEYEYAYGELPPLNRQGKSSDDG